MFFPDRFTITCCFPCKKSEVMKTNQLLDFGLDRYQKNRTLERAKRSTVCQHWILTHILCYEFDVPWKHKRPNLPNNHQVAERRLELVEKLQPRSQGLSSYAPCCEQGKTLAHAGHMSPRIFDMTIKLLN